MSFQRKHNLIQIWKYLEYILLVEIIKKILKNMEEDELKEHEDSNDLEEAADDDLDLGTKKNSKKGGEVSDDTESLDDLIGSELDEEDEPYDNVDDW